MRLIFTVSDVGVSATVMLLNLTRMRTIGWERELLSLLQNYGEEMNKLKVGDEVLINAFFHDRPGKCDRTAQKYWPKQASDRHWLCISDRPLPHFRLPLRLAPKTPRSAMLYTRSPLFPLHNSISSLPASDKITFTPSKRGCKTFKTGDQLHRCRTFWGKSLKLFWKILIFLVKFFSRLLSNRNLIGNLASEMHENFWSQIGAGLRKLLCIVISWQRQAEPKISRRVKA